MKKLFTKKAATLVVGVLLALGVADLTLLEDSHLKPVIQSVSDTISDLLGLEAEVVEEAPSAE